MKTLQSPGFIVGVGRSGTTLLAAILNRHPLVRVLPETTFFHLAANYHGGFIGFTTNWPDSLRQIAAKMNNTPTFNAKQTAEQVIARFGQRTPSLGEIFLEFGDATDRTSAKRLWIEKTPVHIRYLREIRSLYPEAPIIHLIRDGRAVAESRSRMPYLTGESKDYYNNLLAWSQSLQHAHAQLAKDPHAYELHYEDFVTQPERSLRAICTFLGLEYFEDLAEPDGSEPGLKETWATHKEGIGKPLDPELTTRWKTVLSEPTRLVSDVLAGNELEKWGYEVTPKGLKKEVSVLLTKDFFKPHLRPVLIEIIKQLARMERPARLNGFVSMDDQVSRKVDIRTTPPLEVQCVPWTSCTILRPGILLATTPRIVADGSLSKRIWGLIRLSHTLRKWALNGTRLVWVYDGKHDQTKNWRYRRSIEKIMAGQASAIVCNCGHAAICETRELLAVEGRPVLHVPGDKLELCFPND